MELVEMLSLFHNPADRGPEAINAAVIDRFVDVFAGVALKLAGSKS